MISDRLAPCVTEGDRPGPHGWGTASRSPDGQPGVVVNVLVVTPEIEAFVATQPPGMVAVESWLAPAG